MTKKKPGNTITEKNIETIAQMERALELHRTMGERVADGFAAVVGSWAFIIIQTVALTAWVVVNLIAWQHRWDPYPFILLNLVLSFQAAYASPIIMMSQNRQDAKDRVRSELDYEVNRRAAGDIQGLARKLNLLGEQISDLEDRIRDKPIAR